MAPLEKTMNDGLSNRERSLLDRLEKAREEKGAAKAEALAAKRETAKLRQTVKTLTD
jgi:hypothetical protein